MPIDFVPAVHHSPTAIYDRPDKTMVPVNPLPPSAGPDREHKHPTAVVHVVTPNTGFDRGDAGIGAAGGLALSVIAVGEAFAVSGRRGRRSTALPS